MRLKKILFPLLCVLGALCSHAQQKKPLPAARVAVGTHTQWTKQMLLAGNKTLKPPFTDTFRLLLADGDTAPVVVKSHTVRTGVHTLLGNINQEPLSAFRMVLSDTGMQGTVIVPRLKKSWKYYSTGGVVYREEVPIGDLMCVDYRTPQQVNVASHAATGVFVGASHTTVALIPDVADVPAAAQAATQIPDLQSYPGAAVCVLLDFDGQAVSGTLWNGGVLINAQPSSMLNDSAAVRAAYELIKEDFLPFGINITTNESVYLTYPVNKRMRCIFTPTTTAYPGVGGVAYTGSLSWTDEIPCWVFLTGKSGSEAASHEIGHTLGLSHDGKITDGVLTEYYTGQGNWAPIMGQGYNRSIVHWSKGEYEGANNKENDIAIITAVAGLRTDDHGNTIATATVLTPDANGRILADAHTGIIGTVADVDYFSYVSDGSAAVFQFSPHPFYGNLDIKVQLYNAAGVLLNTYDSSGQTVRVPLPATASTYYLAVSGTGYADVLTTGYSNYGSLGAYSIEKIPAALKPGATYKILSLLNGKAVSVASGSMTAAAKVVQIPYAASSNLHQQWVLKAEADDYYSLVAVHSGMALSVAGSSVASGTELVQEAYASAPNQLYKLVFVGNGAFQLISGVSNKAVEIPGSSFTDGTVLTQNGVSNTSVNQHFVFEWLKDADPIVAKDITAVTNEATAVTLDLTAYVTPRVGETANLSSVSFVKAAAHGRVAYNAVNGQLVYTPDNGFSGSDVFTYTIKTVSGLLSNTAAITITVKKAPVAGTIRVTAESGKATTFSVIAYVTAGDAVLAVESLALAAQPAHGSVVLPSGGQLVYTSAAGFTGNDTCYYTMGDANKATSAPGMIVFTVNNPVTGVRVPVTTLLSPASGSGFRITGFEQYSKVSLVISNANGQRVYAADQYVNGAFTGSGLAAGMYYYVLTLQQGNGKQIMKGNVCLVY